MCLHNAKYDQQIWSFWKPYGSNLELLTVDKRDKKNTSRFKYYIIIKHVAPWEQACGESFPPCTGVMASWKYVSYMFSHIVTGIIHILYYNISTAFTLPSTLFTHVWMQCLGSASCVFKDTRHCCCTDRIAPSGKFMICSI